MSVVSGPDLTKRPVRSALKTSNQQNYRSQFLVRNVDYTDTDSSDYESDSESTCGCGNEEGGDEGGMGGGLAARVQRIDSLSRFLNNRPKMNELIEKNIMPTKPESERRVDRSEIEIKLERKLSLRPTPRELEQRNILHTLTQDELKKQVSFDLIVQQK